MFHFGPNWRHLGLTLKPSSAILGGILCHLGVNLGSSWGHIRPNPSQGVSRPFLDPPKLRISPKSTKTKNLSSAGKGRRAGGGRPPKGSQSAAQPLWVGATARQIPSPRSVKISCKIDACHSSCPKYSARALILPPYIPPIAPCTPQKLRRVALFVGLNFDHIFDIDF